MVSSVGLCNNAPVHFTRVRFLLIFGWLSFSSAQNCYNNLTCGECIKSADCGWCPGSGTCIDYITGYCYGNRALSCAVFPSPAAAAWSHADALGTVAIGVISILVLALLTFTAIESRCGQFKTDLPALRLRLPRPTQTSIRVLFVASAALWMGLSFALAVPALPWLAGTDITGSTVATLNAFSFQLCPRTSNNDVSFCYTINLRDFITEALKRNPADYEIAMGFVDKAAALGGLGKQLLHPACSLVDIII
jgi:hypothetical protein